MSENVVTMSGLPYVAAGPDVTYPDGWFESAPFADGVLRLCLGSFGGVRGHVKANLDGSFTAYHGDLQLGTVKDLEKAKTAVETGKKVRQRGESRKRKAAKNGQEKADLPSQSAEPAAETAGQALPAAVPGQAAADQPGVAGTGLPLAGGALPLPVVPLPAVMPVAGLSPHQAEVVALFEAPPTGLPLPPAALTNAVVGVVDLGSAPLPALPTEPAATKPKDDDILTLDQLRVFMPPDWCDQLEQVATRGFQLKDQELDYKVNYRGSNHRDVPKYYDGPPTMGVEPLIVDLLKRAGLDKVRVPGGLVMIVGGTSEARLNREKLMRAGVTVAVLDACTDPGTPYTSVTFKRDRR